MQQLNAITQDQLAKLQQELKQKKMLILVHPLFGADKNAAFEQMLQKGRHEKYVTLVMDAPSMRPTIQTLIDKTTSRQKEIYFLETVGTLNPQPIIGWRNFVKTLTKIGAKKVVVGGRAMIEITSEGAECAGKEWAERIVESIKEREELSWARRQYAKNRDALKALRTSGQQKGKFYGCAGRTAAKLTNTKKFKVKTTTHFA